LPPVLLLFDAISPAITPFSLTPLIIARRHFDYFID
jgi:hypothetical protein